jgi:hypothetical protein
LDGLAAAPCILRKSLGCCLNRQAATAQAFNKTTSDNPRLTSAPRPHGLGLLVAETMVGGALAFLVFAIS